MAPYDVMFNPFSVLGSYPTTFEDIRTCLKTISYTDYEIFGFNGKDMLALWDTMTPDQREKGLESFTTFILWFKADLVADETG